MARTGLEDVRSLPDPLQSWNFDLIIPSVPGGGDTNMLKIKCMSTSLPGVSVDEVPVQLHGVEVRYAGRETYSHQLEVSFLETRDMSTRDALRGWLELARNNQNNTGSYKEDYSTEAFIVLYDDTTAVIRTIKLFGVFVQTVGDGQLEGSSSTPVTINATFSYDFHMDS